MAANDSHSEECRVSPGVIIFNLEENNLLLFRFCVNVLVKDE